MATPGTTISQNSGTITGTDGTSKTAASNGHDPEEKRPRVSSQTQAVHAGEKRYISHDSLTVPIVQTSTYTFEDTASLINYMEEHMFWDVPEREEYGRYGNPTVRAAEAKLAALDAAEDALLLSSGMAAITTTLFILLSQGDHFVMTEDCYRRTRGFCNTFLTRFGITCTTVAPGDYDAIEAAIRPATKLIFSESPTNPFLRCVDYARLVEIAERHGLRTIIDTTFATPCNVRPLEYGIDLAIHSVTKYLAGHNDLLAGCVTGSFDITTALRQSQGILGAVVDPHCAYLILRGIKTLGLRMRQHNESAFRIARYLEDHPRIRRVWYPGLESHPDHEVAKCTMTGFGGVISFEVEADGPTTSRFIDACVIPRIGPSLGGVESLIEQPGIVSYFDTAPEDRRALGITDELVRLSVGIEDTDDLLADFEQALASM
ncbi:MAG: aminotransferase class I/II-fold pyridoxal phosphate-dependent enzyme [Caldilineaceae bacterium SB0661_bin_32]|uniref:homocysteine desulfhydrase n=1 Tax=Caldilineaceae bacterium SB0661_bin_32 TaxID=2605255 RepID=A0A6B1D8B4_9CHLR|nr:aminotransferase class I/II-fold pyridoxal phosphate-dependent enzyme [Caldilineaceae bacterium SB0661_bin_32]